MSDPWSRPSITDLKQVLESIGSSTTDHNRTAERLELLVPAEVVTSRGSTVSAMTREISHLGLGLVHRGSINPGKVEIRMTCDTLEYRYNVLIEWCAPCNNGMYISGGSFINHNTSAN